MHRLKNFALALLLAAIPASAAAQTQVELDFQGATEHYNGMYIAPYKLQVLPSLGGPVIDVFCVDPTITAHKSTYTGWVSPVTTTSLQYTKAYGYTGGDPAATFATYWKTAWLATQFEELVDGTSTLASNTLAERAAIQGALWEVGGMLPRNGMSSGADVWSAYGAGAAPTGISSWVAWANTAYTDDPTQIDASEWVVLTTADDAGQQEFLAHRADVVPEPSTWLLLGTGLIGLFGVAFKRGLV